MIMIGSESARADLPKKEQSLKLHSRLSFVSYVSKNVLVQFIDDLNPAGHHDPSVITFAYA